MKLSTRDAVGYFKRPDPDRTGLLIYGGDAMRVALRRQEVIAALIGPNGDDEMRLSRISAAELRKDKAMLGDAIKAQSFFPGPRVAFVEDATDVVTLMITDALEDWAPGDAQVIVTAGALKASSKLRKLFEGHKNAYAAGIYDDPPSRGEIEDQLKAAGVSAVSNDAMTDLVALSRELGPGDGFFLPADQPYAYHAGPDGVKLLEFRHDTAFDMKVYEEDMSRFAAKAMSSMDAAQGERPAVD